MELMMYMCVWECVSVCGRGTWRRESSEWRLPCLAVRDHVGEKSLVCVGALS